MGNGKIHELGRPSFCTEICWVLIGENSGQQGIIRYNGKTGLLNFGLLIATGESATQRTGNEILEVNPDAITT